MFVSGFTFIRNGIRYDYPFAESIRSILELCDEFIVLAGNSEDDTRQAVETISSPKIKIYDSVWNASLREGGRVLAEETNKAFEKISGRTDWAFYLQGDEVIHERYLDSIRQAMLRYKDDHRVEGLLFDFVHFYGSYDYAGDSRRWYRKEVRIIRNDPSIRSWRDAQGFRKNGKKLKVKPVNAQVFHYGWVKPPEMQQLKQQTFNKYWHDDDWMKKNIGAEKKFDYSKIDSLRKFEGTHPKVMLQRIAEKKWDFRFDTSGKKLTLKDKLLFLIEQKSGRRIGEYRNYKLI